AGQPYPPEDSRGTPYAGSRARTSPRPDPAHRRGRDGAVPGRGRVRLLQPRLRQAGSGRAVPAEHAGRGDAQDPLRLLAPGRREAGAAPTARAQGRPARRHQVRGKPGERRPDRPADAVPGPVPLGRRHRALQPVRRLSPGMKTPRPALALAARIAAAAAATAALAGCGLFTPAASPGASPSPAPVTSQAGPPATAAPPCPAAPARFSCAMRARIAAVRAYLRHRPGVVGVVLRDRSTGAVWENSRAHIPVYMASTSKLAMAVTLLMQDQAGGIHLSGKDWPVMHRMLHVSSDTAADT